MQKSFSVFLIRLLKIKKDDAEGVRVFIVKPGMGRGSDAASTLGRLGESWRRAVWPGGGQH